MQLHLFENIPFEPPPKNNPHESKYQRFKRLNKYENPELLKGGEEC